MDVVREPSTLLWNGPLGFATGAKSESTDESRDTYAANRFRWFRNMPKWIAIVDDQELATIPRTRSCKILPGFVLLAVVWNQYDGSSVTVDSK
jgi:hypothetical protein